MLIRFQASNHRSIREPIELSLVAIDRDRSQVRFQPMLGESLVQVVGIYGPNASGKSNVMSALAWLTNAVLSSLRTWSHTIPVDPFASDDGLTTPSEYEIELLVGGVRFEYLLELTSEGVSYEGLFHYPEKKRRRVFEREGLDLTIQRGLGPLSGLRKLLTNQTLFLSAASQWGEPITSAFIKFLADIQMPYLQGSRAWSSTLDLFDTFLSTERHESDGWPDGDLLSTREQSLALLRLADRGIQDVDVYEDEIRLASGNVHKIRGARVKRSADGAPKALDLVEESQGTATWFQMLGPVMRALRKGSPILVDELDASLHPKLSAELVRLFRSPQLNQNGAQLIFTSHDTSLLAHLNRDEVWLCDKQEDGSTRLGPLSDFATDRVKRSQNLESGYLGGRFGALPQFDQLELLRAFGLIG
ncbi:MAG: AAA family ATPase [Propionibacteriaceae bacterium]|jgi:energy-coupling factor transporter ATP-binding protein EcfA2|nr:AAA family ATPase [Propionibacteriaceae bacterium]